MKAKYLFVVLFVGLVARCKQNAGKTRMLPEPGSNDSAVIMYYHKPGEPRFFNMVKIKDPGALPEVTTDVNGKQVKAENDCVTQGKIYFYGKGGAVETVYFSRDPECMTLSFIKTGKKYFTRMSEKTLWLLNRLEKEVVVLAGDGE